MLVERYLGLSEEIESTHSIISIGTQHSTSSIHGQFSRPWLARRPRLSEGLDCVGCLRTKPKAQAAPPKANRGSWVSLTQTCFLSARDSTHSAVDRTLVARSSANVSILETP